MNQSSERAAPRQRIPVLLYHRIDSEKDNEWRRFCVSPPNFRRQMRWFAERGYETINLHQLLDYYEFDAPIPERPLVITFDDGYYCNYSRAFPIMRDCNLTGTIFLSADLMRTSCQAPAESRHSFLAWVEIREMAARGWHFGAHGLHHRPMTACSQIELQREIVESKQCISEKLGCPVDFFCYPFSQFNTDVIDAVRRAGYRGACGGLPLFKPEPFDPYTIGRTEIMSDDTFREFVFKVEHGFGYFLYAKRQMGKWGGRLCGKVW